MAKTEPLLLSLRLILMVGAVIAGHDPDQQQSKLGDEKVLCTYQ
jgi:hypothetical protein